MLNNINHKYSVVVFDLGNVLLPFSYESLRKKFNSVEPNMGNKFLSLYKENYNIHRSFEKGELSEDEFLETMMSWTEHRITKIDFCEIYSNIFTVNKEVVELLPILGRKYKLVLLSNTNSIHQKYGWKDFAFVKYFDKLILSHEVKAYKPEHKIYNAVKDFTKVPSEEHIFIDDIKDYVEGAKKMGWNGIHFTGYQNLLKEFKEKNIL